MNRVLRTTLTPPPVWFCTGLLFFAALGAPCIAQAPITNGLVSRWSGNGDALDSAGHFDGTVSGGLRYVPGPAGQAFQFNGADARVDFGPGAGNFGTRDFAISFWIKTDSKVQHEAFFSKRASCSTSPRFWDIQVGSGVAKNADTGILVFTMAPGGATIPYELYSSRPMNDGQWHHIVWVRQSTSSGGLSCLIYVDGAFDNSTIRQDGRLVDPRDYPEEVDVSSPTPVVLGQNICQCCDGCRAYSGAAAEFQLFSHALSAEDILAIYKAGNPAK
jgi:hypothetical protein